MRTLLILLLLCWVSSAADGLKCYSCADTNNTICNQKTEPCHLFGGTCMTIVPKTGYPKIILKTCTTYDECEKVSFRASIAFITQLFTEDKPAMVTCCSTDLCNFSGATTARLHTLLLVLPLCVISALCYVSA
nr:prostate stem cell antigen-like isoform X1 [Paramormyrops kingsleyae]